MCTKGLCPRCGGGGLTGQLRTDACTNKINDEKGYFFKLDSAQRYTRLGSEKWYLVGNGEAFTPVITQRCG